MAALIWQLPAQPFFKHFAGGALGPNAVAAGTVWRGQITGADAFGPVIYRLRPLHALTAKPPLQVKTRMPGISMEGKAGRSGLRDVSISGQVWTFSNVDGRLAGLSGDFSVQIEKMSFDPDALAAGCTEAAGTARTNILKSNDRLWSWRGPALSGPLACENGALVLTLSGTENGQSAEMLFKAFADGRYNGTLSIQTSDGAAQNVMALFGFSRSGDRYTLRETGRWQ